MGVASSSYFEMPYSPQPVLPLTGHKRQDKPSTLGGQGGAPFAPWWGKVGMWAPPGAPPHLYPPPQGLSGVGFSSPLPVGEGARHQGQYMSKKTYPCEPHKGEEAEKGVPYAISLLQLKPMPCEGERVAGGGSGAHSPIRRAALPGKDVALPSCQTS
jgi:hypothetical protein